MARNFLNTKKSPRATFLSPKLRKLGVKELLTARDVIAMFEELVERCWSDPKFHKYLECAFFNAKKPLGHRLFDAIARLSVNVAFEAVALKQNRQTGEVEVFMIKRRPFESFPGQWHCPGSIFRPGEKPADVLKRISGRREFGAKLNSDFKVVDQFFFREERGWFLSLVYLVRPVGRPKAGGRWWPVKKLPKATVLHHADSIIPAAMRAFAAKIKL